jgi:azurin
MKRLGLVTLLAVATAASSANLFAQAPKAAAGAGRTIDIAGGDDMKFSITEFTVKPGETVRIRLKSTGTLPKLAMAHNVVVLKPKTDVAGFITAAATARDTNYIPAAQKAEVITATTLVGPGETTDVTFKAPAAVGKYPFICSFPGHYAAGMRGTMTVGK